MVVGVLKESDHMGGGGAGGSYQPPPVSLDSARFRPASVRLKKLLSCIAYLKARKKFDAQKFAPPPPIINTFLDLSEPNF